MKVSARRRDSSSVISRLVPTTASTPIGVTLISAGLDEVPMAYKDIEDVMAAQADLVEPLARFPPRLVKMAPGGEPPED